MHNAPILTCSDLDAWSANFHVHESTSQVFNTEKVQIGDTHLPLLNQIYICCPVCHRSTPAFFLQTFPYLSVFSKTCKTTSNWNSVHHLKNTNWQLKRLKVQHWQVYRAMAQVHTHGLAAIQPHVAQVCRFNDLHPSNFCIPYTYMDYYSCTNPKFA